MQVSKQCGRPATSGLPRVWQPAQSLLPRPSHSVTQPCHNAGLCWPAGSGCRCCGSGGGSGKQPRQPSNCNAAGRVFACANLRTSHPAHREPGAMHMPLRRRGTLHHAMLCAVSDSALCAQASAASNADSELSFAGNLRTASGASGSPEPPEAGVPPAAASATAAGGSSLTGRGGAGPPRAASGYIVAMQHWVQQCSRKHIQLG
jgi:hypothetical protein